MGAFGNLNAKPTDLTNPINPFFRKSQWKRQLPPICIGNGIEEYWDVDNPRVWNALEPVLRLDGLFNGTWLFINGDTLDVSDLPNATLQKYGAYQWFARRDFTSQEPVQRELNETIEEMIPRVKFGFDTTYSRAAGKTVTRLSPLVCNVEINIELVFPLVKGDLSESERLVESFSIARTHVLVNEPIFLNRRRDIRPLIPLSLQLRSASKTEPEPFYEDEQISEVGNSWENMAFGGSTGTVHESVFEGGPSQNIQRAAKVPYDALDRRVLGIWVSSWSNWGWYSMSRQWAVKKRNPQTLFVDDARVRLWPIVHAYYENIYHTEFWDSYVQALGRDALRIPKLLGLAWPQGPWRTPIKIMGPDYGVYVGDGKHPHSSESPMLLPPPPLEMNEVKYWLYEQQRRVKQNAVVTALRIQREEEWDKEQMERWLVIENMLIRAMEALREGDLKEAERLIKMTEECDSTRLNIIRGYLVCFFYLRYPVNSPEKQLGVIEGKKAQERFYNWVAVKKSWSGTPIYLDGLYQKLADIACCSWNLSEEERSSLENRLALVKVIDRETWRRQIEQLYHVP
ncbi:hypothetical protein HYALB_00008498 [Hymenoscyphus albidus]|uniref:Uncharacterized protein n=1 Tax=Hymenoscyphus albidus TaxID=595503 RepID=A0A9N9LS35_9HELO|nr:hypothetical protein HYALB_00008498 [Hymenoscyphus albidus]